MAFGCSFVTLLINKTLIWQPSDRIKKTLHWLRRLSLLKADALIYPHQRWSHSDWLPTILVPAARKRHICNSISWRVVTAVFLVIRTAPLAHGSEEKQSPTNAGRPDFRGRTDKTCLWFWLRCKARDAYILGMVRAAIIIWSRLSKALRCQKCGWVVVLLFFISFFFQHKRLQTVI